MLAARTSIGVFWRFTEELGRRGIGLITTLCLAQFLVPEDFGLISMLAVFVAVANLIMESGFKDALIRMQHPKQVDFDTAFLANLAIGAVAYSLLYAGAPVIAEFYAEPRLAVLIRVVGLIVVVNSFQTIQYAILSRNLDFKLQLSASVPSAVASGLVAVSMAFLGYGVWALVFQMLTYALVFTIRLWWKQKWCPTFSFSVDSFAAMFGFGSKVFLAGLINTLFRNIFVVVIAKMFSPGLAGLYFFADKVRDVVVSQLITSVQTASYPALASIQQDDQRLKEGIRRLTQVATYMVYPLLMLVAALAEPLFHGLVPSRWYPAIVLLQLMCLARIMYPLHVINLNVLKIKGRSDLVLYVEILKKLVVVAILTISVRYGVVEILIGQIVSSVVTYLPNSYLAATLIRYTVREQIGDVLPAFLLSSGISLVAYASVEMLSWSPIIKVLVIGPTALGVYVGISHTLRLSAHMDAIHIVRRRFRVTEQAVG